MQVPIITVDRDECAWKKKTKTSLEKQYIIPPTVSSEPKIKMFPQNIVIELVSTHYSTTYHIVV